MFLIFVVWLLVRDLTRPPMLVIEWGQWNRGQERLVTLAVLAALVVDLPVLLFWSLS